ncbi:MAG: RHS domain-containing protein [Deltaproteobacteria bacterium]|nr:RHS domain-containing protein [Deltaproteobacteria bacterium]MCL5278176.1 RHS domain-containing protein [Deltaproteobacteria bacterium]
MFYSVKKACYTYATLVNAMLSIASEKNIDLQTFIGLLIPSDEIKADVSNIVNRVNQRGVNATLEKKDIKLFKRLFEDMEEVFDHMKGLNPADPAFAYDAAGYITEETVSGTLLTYDTLGRLTQVSNTSGAVIGQYTYDGMNRRITKTTGGTTTIFIYDIYNNLIGEYDASTGNTTKEYVYLGSKALAMITEPTTSSSSGCGSINVGSGCSTVSVSMSNRGNIGMGAIDGFIYLFPLIGIAIIRLNRSAKKRKLDIIGLLVISGMVILIVMISRQTHAQATGEQVYYYHLDHLGTPIEMTDQSQNVVWQASYDPFGQATISTATITNNIRFPGMYSDSETGLYYNINRYYYPSIGRYIEPDPILQPMVFAKLNTGSIFNELLVFFAANPQQLNEYLYTMNNPVNQIDPFGRQNTTTYMPPPNPSPSQTLPTQGPKVSCPCTPTFHGNIFSMCIYQNYYKPLIYGTWGSTALGVVVGGAIGGAPGAGIGAAIGGAGFAGGFTYMCYKEATYCDKK